MYALITGASSGIGKQMAFILAKKGYDLVLVSRSIEKLEQIKETIKKDYNKEAICLKVDLANRGDINDLFSKTKDYDFDVVINNAGLGRVGMFNEISDDFDYQMIDVNVTAMHMVLKHYADAMTHGHILSVASIAAFAPGPKMATYYATKNYILAYAEAIRFELKKMKKKVGITILCPGPVSTNFDNVAEVNFKLPGISATKCAEYGLKRMFKNKKLASPKLIIRVSTRIMRILPHSIVMRICYRAQSKKK